MENIEIFPMTKDDFAAVSQLFIEAFGPDELGEPWTDDTSYEAVKEGFVQGYSFVAKDNNAVIGALVGGPSTYEKGTELWIEILVVAAKSRGKGVGKKLIDKAINLAKHKRFVGLRLSGNPKLRSFTWYHELGFKESGWVELVKFFDEK